MKQYKVKHEIQYHDIIECITCALDARDTYTAGHSKRVSDMALRVCYVLRLKKKEIQKIHIAAHLHDIGKIGVPDVILHQASKSGVSKINVDTDLRLAMTSEIRKVLVEEPSVFDPRKYLTPARESVKKTVQHKIRDVFGSSNKA